MNNLIWSTKKIEELEQLIKNGENVKFTPYYDGNKNIKKGNIVFKYTPEELEEYKKCLNDIIYFVENYCYIKIGDGYSLAKLREYQKVMLRSFQKNRHNIVLAARQIGKTITASLFLTWYSIFHNDKNILLLANKWVTTKEIMQKIKKIILSLPFFLKPGVIKWDVYEMVFDNGSHIIGQTTTEKSGIGFTIDLLYLDEFAHIKHTFLDEFFENVLPTISANSSKTKIIITSTPNGANKFYELYKGAVMGVNTFVPIKIDWWQVPGRDEQWMKEQVALLGQEGFNRQYGNQFFSAGSLLISAALLKVLHHNKKNYYPILLDKVVKYGLNIDSYLYLREDYNLNNFKDEKRFFFMGIDLSSGVGNDYSVINIFELDILEKKLWPYNYISQWYDFFKLEQVGYIRVNNLSIDILTKLFFIFLNEYVNIENVKVVLEWNYGGEYFYKYLFNVYEDINEISDSLFVKYTSGNKKYPGIRIGSNKNTICEEFIKYLGNGKIEVTAPELIFELENFVKTEDNKYVAQLGNDDMVMSSIILSTVFLTSNFKNFCDLKFEILDKNLQKEIEEYLETYNLKNENKNLENNNINNDTQQQFNNLMENWYLLNNKFDDLVNKNNLY